MDQAHTPSPRRASTAGRLFSISGAVVAGLLATALLAAGGLALWGDSKKDDQGYLTTSGKPFATTGAALATDNLDVNTGAPGWLVGEDEFGTVRLQVHSTSDAPVFVGIAPTKDVSAYLAGSPHSTVTDVETSPFRAEYRAHDGDRRPAPPADQGIWAASTHGTGTQSLSWPVEDGDWSVVVMNEDGSPGVNARVSAGAKVGFLDDIGFASLGIGVVLLGVAGGLLFLGVRPPRSRPSTPSAPSRPDASDRVPAAV